MSRDEESQATYPGVGEARYRQIVERAPELIFINRDDRILYVNPAGAAMLGAESAAQLVGRPVFDLFHSSVHELVRSRIAVLRAAPGTVVPTVPETITRIDGRTFEADVSAVSYRTDGHVDIQVTCRDVSERRRHEAEVRRLTAELELRVAERTSDLAAARDKAESADRLKTSFLATMSHELRTPLNSIVGFTDLLLHGYAGPLNDEQSKQLRLVHAAAHHVLALVNDVLDISKIEAGQLTLAPASIDVQALLDRLEATFAPQATRRGVALRREGDAGELPHVLGDPRRIEQIMNNLLSNALKFTPAGTIRLSGSLVEGEYVALHVQDTGIGIRAEHFNRLFQPFSQISHQPPVPTDGSGLGLAISQALAQLMGGRIDVASEFGVGSCFSLLLPPEKL